ncbi:E3 ubiquitin-protein ligase makorin-1, partial [Biomphalaria glabrata]
MPRSNRNTPRSQPSSRNGSVRRGHPYAREYRVGLDLRGEVTQPHSQTYGHHQPLTPGHVHTRTTDQRSQAFGQPIPEFSSQLQPQTSGQLHPQTSGRLHHQTYSQLNLEATNQILSTTSTSENDTLDWTDDFLTYRLREESETDSDIIEVISDDNIAVSTYDSFEDYIYVSSDDSSDESIDDSTDDSADDNSDDSSDDSTDDILIVENKREICSLEGLEGSSLSSEDESLTPEMCSQNIVGDCHDLSCPFCKKPKLHPTNVKQRSQHMQDCLFEQSKDKTCEVCFEIILQPHSGNRFGLQQNCKHCFCIGCLSTWGDNKTMANH